MNSVFNSVHTVILPAGSTRSQKMHKYDLHTPPQIKNIGQCLLAKERTQAIFLKEYI